MKNITLKLIFILITLVAAGITSYGQAIPQGFNYMAIARDENGDILPGLPMTVIIAITEDEPGETIVWEETHEVTTSETGLFQIIVGKGASTGNGSAPLFEEIDWTMQPLYIKTSIDLKGELTEMGSAQLFSVPYAMVSNLAYSGVDNPFIMDGDTVVFLNSVDVRSQAPVYEEDPLFEVKRQDGKTMFAVYNQGVRINVPLDDAIKGAKGGFSIGGFSGAKEDIEQNLFVLNKDSARIYIDQTPDLLPKGAKGGFSVGGFNYAAGKEGLPIQEYLSITPVNARINVGGGTKAAKGGFSVGGFGSKTGESVNFMNITPENYFIGHESGIGIQTTGLYNSVIGYQAGKSLTTGGYNTMLGYLAGTSATTGNNNILIGNFAGNNLTFGEHNTLIGNSAGLNHTDQMYNVMIGTSAGNRLNSPSTSGSWNTFVGINAGFKIITSRDNAFYGTNAGYMLESGGENTIIGIDAGRGGEDDPDNYHGYIAEKNTIVGNKAGRNLKNGSGNVLIGYGAGYDETGSNKLHITNSIKILPWDPPVTPLIYGDFSTYQVGINTMSLTETLNVGGNTSISGTLSANSISAASFSTSGSFNGNLTGNVTGNVSGSASNIGGVTMGVINSAQPATFLTACGGIYSLSIASEVITVTNNSGTYCALWYQGQQATSVSGSIVINNPAGSTFSLPAFTPADAGNGQGVEIHFGKPYGGAYCSVWVSWSNSRLVGHYIMYP